MVYEKIIKIKKEVFTYRDMARAIGIKEPSARVAANRLAGKGLIIRIKRDLYVLADRWPYISKEAKFAIANIMQVPSYISLMTALDYHGITTQMQRDFIESIAIKWTRKKVIKDTVFMFTKIARSLYFGFTRREGVFIADPEKALLDALYLSSLKRYSFDTTSINVASLDRKRLDGFAVKFPMKIQKLLGDIYGRSAKT